MKTKTKRTMPKKYVEALLYLGACYEAIEWFCEHSSPSAAWENCQRGDWMLWLIGKLSGEPGSEAKKPLILCCCDCARLSLKHVKLGELRPLKAIETAESWARGDSSVSLTDVRAAADAADAAAADAAYAGAYAAHAAAYAAAYAADAAAYAADVTAYAAAYAYTAAAAAVYAAVAAAAARIKTLADCADIVRKHYPKAPKI